MRTQPFLYFAVLLSLGIIFQEKFSLQGKAVISLGIISLLLGSLCLFRNYRMLKFRSLIYGQFYFCLGVVLFFISNIKADAVAVSGNQQMVFHITEKLNANENNRRYLIKTSAQGKDFRAVLSVPRKWQELDFLHLYQAELSIRPIEKPKYSYQFNYADYMSKKGVYHQGFLVKTLSQAPRKHLSLLESIKQHRFELLQKINTTSLSERSKEFLKGIILADRTEMSQETVQDFTRTGLVHILAISGSHIAILFSLVFWVCSIIFTGKFRRWSIYISLAFIWLFGLYIGLGNSVFRACLMLTFYFVYRILQRKQDLLHSMSLAGIVILLTDPKQLFDVGFQLSFLAVFGIFWLNMPLQHLFMKPKTKLHSYLLGIPSVTLAAQMATTPLVLYYFHQFSWTSIIANLVIIPFSGLMIVSSLILVVAIGLNISSTALEKIYEWIITIVLDVIHWFAGFQGLFIKNIAFSAWEAMILFGAVLLLRPLLKKFSAKNLLYFSAAIGLLMIVRTSLNYFFERKQEVLVHEYYRIKVLSVKQGNRVDFFIPKDANHLKIEKYIAVPYMVSVRAKELELHKLPPKIQQVRLNGKDYDLR